MGDGRQPVCYHFTKFNSHAFVSSFCVFTGLKIGDYYLDMKTDYSGKWTNYYLYFDFEKIHVSRVIRFHSGFRII